MSLRDDINIPVIVVLGVSVGLIVAVAIIGTQAGYNYVTQAELARNYEDPDAQARVHYGRTVWEPQQKALDGAAGWANVTKTAVHIPLADAKRIMIETKGKPPLAPASQPTSQPAAK